MSGILLGIDIGTSSCKAAAFSPDGSVLAQANEEYPVYYPHPGWAEQDPNDWWAAVCRAIRSLGQKGVDLSQIEGIGIDGQSWSAVAVDADGSVLCRTPIWMDTRAEDICRELRESFGEDRLFSVSGNPVQPTYTMPKVLWYRRNDPVMYQSIDKILQSNSFIVLRLTGVCSQDPSQGYGWNCFDIRKGCWDRDLCRDIGVSPDLLPELVPCHHIVGRVTADAASQTGLTTGVPVVAGGLDAACGTLGAGVFQAGQTQEQGGQAGGMSICMDTCRADRRLILGTHVVPGLWLLQGGTVAGGAALNWYEKEFGTSERKKAQENNTSSFQEIDAEAQAVPPGSEGVVFLPYLSGERSPIWDAHAKGVFYGIDFSKTRAHMARAVMEGVAYALRHNLEIAAQAGAQAGTLYAMGGAANSKVWTQIKSDITGKEIMVPSSDTATALGAAILAGVGVGMYGSFEQAVRQTVHWKHSYSPNADNRAVYDAGYSKYRNIYENLKQLMSEE